MFMLSEAHAHLVVPVWKDTSKDGTCEISLRVSINGWTLATDSEREH